MTFVIAKKHSPGDIQIFSDIKLTGPNEELLSPKNGALKSWMPAQDLSFSFAGNTDAPIELWSAIRNKVHDTGIGWPEILQLTRAVVQNYSGGNSQGAEFIVSMARGEGTIAKVTSQGIFTEQQTCWIGDIEAFRKYQGYFLSDDGLEINSLQERNAWAFSKFIGDGGVDSAGQFEFSIRIDHDLNNRPFFNYTLDASTISGLASKAIHLEAGERKVLQLGGAEDGVCSVSKVRSFSGDFSGAGLYFSEARFGFFFCPNLGIESISFTDVGPQDFLRLVSEKLGVSVEGLISSGAGFQLLRHP